MSNKKERARATATEKEREREKEGEEEEKNKTAEIKSGAFDAPRHPRHPRPRCCIIPQFHLFPSSLRNSSPFYPLFLSVPLSFHHRPMNESGGFMAAG